MTKWLCTLFLAYSLSLQAAPLQKRFDRAQPGDFIVTSIQGHFSLLMVRSSNEKRLLLEEIFVPEKWVALKNFNWQKWIDENAPGHTAWTLYEIDRQDSQLIDCFSYSKKGWLYLSASEKFFSHLLGLSLSPVALPERKKIGPPPQNGEEDRRPLWNPPLTFGGVKAQKPLYAVFKAAWPKDTSLLSGSTIEFYFNAQDPDFAFPYWIEIKSPHYTFKMPIVDSGRGLKSPYPAKMPQRVVNKFSPQGTH